MRYFLIQLLAISAFWSLALQSSGQDVQVPRTSIQAPTRSPSSQAGEPRQEDQEPRAGVMGEVTSDYVIIENAFAQLVDDVEVPAEETGKLIDISVKHGATVTVNQVIAKIDSQRTQRMLEEAKLKYDLAKSRADDITSIDAADRKLQLSTVEYEDTDRLYRISSKSKIERNRAKYSMQIAELELMAARHEKQLALLEADTQSVAVNAATDSLARHQLRSTLDGEVFEVLKDKGEWVQAGETVFRIARMDKLRIQGSVSSEIFDPPQIDGRRATATVTLAQGRTEQFTGKVTYVSSENYGDAFQIDVEIDNRKYPGDPKHWILPAGANLEIKIHFDGGTMARREVPQR